MIRVVSAHKCTLSMHNISFCMLLAESQWYPVCTMKVRIGPGRKDVFMDALLAW